MRDLILADVLLSRTLAAADLDRLVAAAGVLADTRHWEGCDGLRIDARIKATIAGQAAMLLLGLPGYHFDEVRTILVYPGRFIPDWEDELGLEREDDPEVHLGQSVHDGPVILSWWDAMWQAKRTRFGNVVMHEFAHKLAELGNPELGMPPFADRVLEKRWRKVMRQAWKQLGRDEEAGRPTLLDPYGAESPAEFFAVATETFFLRPAALRARHAEVYEMLAACYRQDPAARPAPPAEEERESELEYDRHIEKECTAAIRLHPGLLSAYEERAECRTRLGDIEGALADWAVLAEESADGVLGKAWTLQEAGRLEEALAACDEAAALDPESADAACQRAATLEMMGRHAEALAAFGEVLEIEPDDAQALAARGRLLRLTGRLPEALADLDRASLLDPWDAATFEERAEALEALGRKAEAEADRLKARTLAT